MLLTDNQLTIMEIFWRSDNALTSADILERVPKERSFQDNSVFAILNALQKKGAIEEVGAKKGSKGKFFRQFAAAITRKEYFSSGAFANTDILQLVSALIKDADFSLSDIEKLEELLRDRKRVVINR